MQTQTFPPMWMWRTPSHDPTQTTPIFRSCFHHFPLQIHYPSLSLSHPLSLSNWYSQAKMPPFLLRMFLPVLLFVVILPQRSEGKFEQWCIADEQATDAELQAALNYTCGEGGADCSQIQENQPCYLPNTLKDHASFAFNTYYQKFKHSGASCYFNSAAMTTEKDPSHGSCHYDYTP